MKVYLLEYGVAYPSHHETRKRVVETSFARLQQKLVEILQIDGFANMPPYRIVDPRIIQLDIPTPVKQSTVLSLIRGEIYQYAVDEDGEPSAVAAQTHTATESVNVNPFDRPATEDLTGGDAIHVDDEYDEEGLGPSDAELEAQGQEPMSF